MSKTRKAAKWVVELLAVSGLIIFAKIHWGIAPNSYEWALFVGLFIANAFAGAVFVTFFGSTETAKKGDAENSASLQARRAKAQQAYEDKFFPGVRDELERRYDWLMKVRE